MGLQTPYLSVLISSRMNKTTSGPTLVFVLALKSPKPALTGL